MQGDYWNDFYRTGKVSDYLKYVDSARNTAEKAGTDKKNDGKSVNHAGKSDGNGAFGHTGW